MSERVDRSGRRRTAIARAIVQSTPVFGPGSLGVYPDDFLKALRRNGYDVMPIDGADIADRLWARTTKSEGGCWIFAITRQHGHAYGMLKYKGRIHAAHRVAWEETHGPISAGLLVLHRCDNPPCVNPEHLFLGTDRDNVHDMLAKGRHRPTRGSAHGNAKLDESKVRDIRRRAGTVTDAALAAEYGVSTGLILKVRRGLAWRHVA